MVLVIVDISSVVIIWETFLFSMRVSYEILKRGTGGCLGVRDSTDLADFLLVGLPPFSLADDYWCKLIDMLDAECDLIYPSFLFYFSRLVPVF